MTNKVFIAFLNFLRSEVCWPFLPMTPFCQQNRQGIYNINRSQILVHECGNWETAHCNSVLEITRPRSFISGNFHFWEYINRNQAFIFDSHRSLIRSASLQLCDPSLQQCHPTPQVNGYLRTYLTKPPTFLTMPSKSLTLRFISLSKPSNFLQ